MKKLCSISLVLLAGCYALTARAMTPEDCKSYQQLLLQNLPSVPAFEAWIQKSQELPPILMRCRAPMHCLIR